MARGAVPVARFTVARAQLKRTKRMLPGTVIIGNHWHPTEELKIFIIEIGADLVVLQACLGF